MLSRFLESRLDRLTDGQRVSLLRLLDLPDNDLWDIVAGRRQAPDPATAEIAGLLR